MTLRDLIDGGVQIEGYVKIQCWEDEDNPTIYWEGHSLGNFDSHIVDYLDREIVYIFPYGTYHSSAICIELAQKED